MNGVAVMFRSLTVIHSKAKKRFPIRERKKKCPKVSRRERIFVSRCHDGISKLQLNSKSLLEVVYLWKKREHAKIADYLVCRTLAFYSFVLG